MPRRTIFIIGPHDLIWDGMRGMLRDVEDFRIAGDMTDARLALAAVVRAVPEVVLIASETRAGSTLDVIGGLQACLPAAIIVVVSERPDPDLLARLVALRFRGYVVRSAISLQMLHEFLALEVEGQVLPLSVTALAAAVDALQRPPAPLPATVPLTELELAIIARLAAGESIAEIAAALGRRPNTVQSHVSRAMRKVNAKNRAHLVALAIRHRLIDV